MDKSAALKAWLEPPWWLGVVLAVITYPLLKWIIPTVTDFTEVLRPIAASGQSSAAYVSVLFLGLTACSLLLAYRRRRTLDLETSLAALRAMPRERFECFAAEAFQNEGYAVAAYRGGRDSGIDLALTRGAEKILVQCRRWRSEAIDAQALTELHDRMLAEAATGCVSVTAGDYSENARRYAAGKPLRLVAGRELERMLRGVERGAASGETLRA